MISRKNKLLYPLRVLVQLSRLPRYIDFFEGRNKQLSQDVEELRASIQALNERFDGVQDDLALLKSIDARLVDLQHKVNSRKVSSSVGEQVVSVNNTVADNHDFDYFYKLFEDKFRGSEEVIKERVSEHLPLFADLTPALRKLPIIDIGCGRGEFLSLMRDHKFHAIGVDMNRSMVERANKLGYEAVEGDALSYLTQKKTGSLAAITGFHIVEHIPFESLLQIFEQCYRTVASSGFVLFETPNPQALTVGADSFYLDPSHQRPIPPPLLAFMLESVGFKSQVLPLHRVKPEITHSDPVVVELYNSLYGAGDYAVVARKI